MKQILLCTDLDRTLLPNGIQPESPAARPLFKKLVAKPFVSLAYVSGRDFNLLQQAITDYNLPCPDFMIGDVGTTIYHRPDGQWQKWWEWQDIICRDWQETTVTELTAQLSDFKELDLQEPEKQSRFKLSYYTAPDTDFVSLQKKVLDRLTHGPAKVKLVASVDEVNRIGLFDVLPAAASKLQAVNFLIKKTGVIPGRTIYAGDSGNDLEVLTSIIKAILVANATSEVRQQATDAAPANSLYLARGKFMQMNGNYAAGLLEGIAHYLPELISVIADEP
ncbi:MAG: HAD-IIB family hydrolase [Thermodesulfobacteriota bacterium]